MTTKVSTYHRPQWLFVNDFIPSRHVPSPGQVLASFQSTIMLEKGAQVRHVTKRRCVTPATSVYVNADCHILDQPVTALHDLQHTPPRSNVVQHQRPTLATWSRNQKSSHSPLILHQSLTILLNSKLRLSTSHSLYKKLRHPGIQIPLIYDLNDHKSVNTRRNLRYCCETLSDHATASICWAAIGAT
jgi:hypothetical protein